MLEAVDQVAQEREPNPALYRMLTGALRTLAERRSPLVTPAFFWKLLSLEGVQPMLDGCARCGCDDDGTELTAFDLEEGGSAVPAVCSRRGSAVQRRRARPAAPDARRWPERRARRAAGHASHEVEHLGIRALEHHVERRLRSTALL